MKNQKGFAGWIVLVVLVVLILGVVGSYIKYANLGNKYEANAEKFHKNTQNVLSATTLKIREVASVPKMYENSLKNLIDATFKGRYGADGSKATMQWIQEQNLQVDSTMFSKIQSVIESGRDEFKLAQDRKNEYCTDYEILRGNVWSGFWLGVAGYPKKDITDICTLVTDAETEEAFKTKKIQAIDLSK